jgi:hypothetical protein
MKFFARSLLAFLLCTLSTRPLFSQQHADSSTDLSHLLTAIRDKAKALESSPATRADFLSFLAARKLPPNSIRYSDYVLVHLLFEATRDAGFLNMRWSITDQPPNSDRIWSQWKAVRAPSFTSPTAIAECDELSALYAFLVERAGVKSVGLFWPYPNHTVAVWVPRLAAGAPIRVVVPTSQIFLSEDDTFDTRKFDPWHQKTIYEYTRRDVPDSLELPKPLFDFFLAQLDKYAGASESAFQQIRNLRSAVFSGSLTPGQAAREALQRRAAYPSSPEDLAAFHHFADDLESGSRLRTPVHGLPAP